jgi:hypothetical protein
MIVKILKRFQIHKRVIKFVRKFVFIHHNSKHIHYFSAISESLSLFARNPWIHYFIISGNICSLNSDTICLKRHDLDDIDLGIVSGWLNACKYIHIHVTTWEWTFSTEQLLTIKLPLSAKHEHWFTNICFRAITNLPLKIFLFIGVIYHTNFRECGISTWAGIWEQGSVQGCINFSAAKRMS